MGLGIKEAKSCNVQTAVNLLRRIFQNYVGENLKCMIFILGLKLNRMNTDVKRQAQHRYENNDGY